MRRRGPASLLAVWGGFGAIIAMTIFHGEGLGGFKPFLNVEALIIVFGGTAACLVAAFPAREVAETFIGAARGIEPADASDAARRITLLRHGADSAVGMGGAATVLGLILMLSSIEDVSAVPRRMALSLTAVFYGLLLSEVVFMPSARRVRQEGITLTLPSPTGSRRFLIGLGTGGSALLGLFAMLYALTAPLYLPR